MTKNEVLDKLGAILDSMPTVLDEQLLGMSIASVHNGGDVFYLEAEAQDDNRSYISLLTAISAVVQMAEEESDDEVENLLHTALSSLQAALARKTKLDRESVTLH